ncbi:MAG: preprotein translocase subunit YajC [Egibacteraceae bacterium]
MQNPALLVAQAEGASALGGLLPLILMGVLFYFLLIRPQQKRARAQRELVRSVERNDRVATVGGLHGTIQSIDEDTMRLEIAPGTVVTMTRQSIARKLIDADTAAGADE